jgi:phosphoserine phosphatase
MGYKLSQFKLAVFDMDSTVIGQETIDEIAAEMGATVKAQVAAITAQAMQGQLSFDQALRLRVQNLAGLPVTRLAAVKMRLVPRAYAAELMQRFKQAGISTYLISGGFQHFAEPLAAELGMDGAFANELEEKEGRLTGRLVGDAVPVNAEGKARLLQTLCQRHQCLPSQVIAVGDGANDIPMVQAAGLGVCFGKKQALAQVAQVQIESCDFKELAAVFALNL